MTDNIRSSRASILDHMSRCLRSWPMPQIEKAHRLALTERELNDLLIGKADEFSLEQLRFIGQLAGVPAGSSNPTHRAITPARHGAH
jgi:hypothetical protein